MRKNDISVSDTKIYFPGDGDGIVHLIDLEDAVEAGALEEYLRDPNNNGYWLYTR